MNDKIGNSEIISRKVRILWKINDQYKKFYWFQMENRDLYWGASGKTSKDFVSEKIMNSDSVTLTIPDSISFNEKVNMKFSYHESGSIHMKQEYSQGNEYFEIDKHMMPIEIVKPKRFFTLITRTICNYEPYFKSLTKGGSNAVVINLTPNQLNNRYYFEFFISPQGTYKAPETLIKMKNSFRETQPIIQSLNKDYILLIRQFEFDGLNDWHPDKEITII